MYERGGKRLLDLVGAGLLLLILAPVMALVALGVRVALGRPVLFRQERAGRGGQPFTLLKFRSMSPGRGGDAERLGRFGRWLRASALDELPQLLNVLRGEMSLVGPRPLPTAYTPLFSPGQAARQSLGGDLALMLRCALLVLRGRGASAPGHATMPAFRGEAEESKLRSGEIA
jgi:lipopolysaccharide/colanic/teichoic acid biosynthesis glycosyltransferase